MKAVNVQLRQSMEELKPLLNRLEGYALRIRPLTVASEDFGFKAVRRESMRQVPKTYWPTLKVLLQHVNTNFAAYPSKGYSEEARYLWLPCR